MDALIGNLKSWFEDYVHRFDSGDPDMRRNHELKAVHTRNVCGNMTDIAGSLGWSGRAVCVAEAAALLHDIGRFEQYRRYRTFVDRKSEDHAALGVSIIRAEGVLTEFDPADARTIIGAVACHNRLSVPEGAEERFLSVLKMVRDADKVDIWRVVTEYYRRSFGERNPAVELDLPDSDAISDRVCDDLMHGRPVRMADLGSLNDFKLLQIGWVYDLNYPRAFQMVLEKGYLEAILEALPENDPRVDAIYTRALAHVKAGRR